MSLTLARRRWLAPAIGAAATLLAGAAAAWLFVAPAGVTATRARLAVAFVTACGAFACLGCGVAFRRAGPRRAEPAPAGAPAPARSPGFAEAVDDFEAFNHSISHDLKSPLSAILTFAQLLEEDHGEALGEAGRERLSQIRTSARGALALMENLRAFTRVGREEVTPAVVSMGWLTRVTFDELVAATGRTGVTLDVGRLPSVRADVSMMRVVLSNLLSNALKFTRARPDALIRVAGGRDAASGDLVFTVADNGAGFDMRHHDRMFQLFERLHSRDEYDGSGMGLAIVERIVRKHGGRSWAVGRPGEGATFHFTLPAMRHVDDGD